MGFTNFMLILFFCQLSAFHFGYSYQPELLSFGDYIEYILTIPSSCFNATDPRNVTNHITRKFVKCTRKITASSLDEFGNLKLICENQENYLQCWNQLKEDFVTNCQQKDHFPGVYVATVKSYCGSDEGNTTIRKLNNTIAAMTPEDRDECLECAIYWLDNCKSTLDIMISDNLCDRQDAIAKCLGKLTCEKCDIGRLQKQLYNGGRAYLNCTS